MKDKSKLLSIEEYMEKLPLELQQEIKDFGEFLLEKRAKRSKKRLGLDWAAVLENIGAGIRLLSFKKKLLSGGKINVLNI